ncbi:hypothetical protein BH18ACT9_BH18ACT9_14080 [soil metagenome]
MLSADSDGRWSVDTLGCRWARDRNHAQPPIRAWNAWLRATTKVVLESGSREVGPHEPDPLAFSGTKSRPVETLTVLAVQILLPRERLAADVDVLAVAHTNQGVRTLNGEEGVEASNGDRVRVRVVNTDNGPVEVWSGAPYRLLAVDGTDLNEPTQVSGRSVTLTAGGRADLEIEVPESDGVRIQIGTSTALVVGPAGSSAAAVPQPDQPLDLLSYGRPAPLGLDATEPDRTFDYSIGRRIGFVDGRLGMWWTINGHLWPDVPMYVVEEGDVVVMRIENHSGQVHPMHLHGHHAVVLSRDDVAASGSPWWADSLNVRDGETYEIAFVADNPGVWMDHCHNLQHAAEGLVAHLMYDGVTTPYRVGGVAGNEPE